MLTIKILLRNVVNYLLTAVNLITTLRSMMRKNQETKKGRIEISYGGAYLAIGILLVMTFVSGYLLGKTKAGGAVAGTVAPTQAPAPVEEPQQNLEAMPAVTDKDYIRGDKNAEAVLVEYSDYECPFCKRFHLTMQQVMKDYGKKVAWVFRHYPLQFHPKAQKSAEAAECAGELGGNTAFWKMTEAIFAKMPEMELAELPTIASQIGLNKSKFVGCLDSGKYADKIKEQQNGGSQAGISGTPGTAIVGKNGKREFIGGALPVEAIKQLIDKVLN